MELDVISLTKKSTKKVNIMKKIVYTLDIDYYDGITKITRPSLVAWAKKIGAKLKIINKRKYPEYPITYEKFQMYEMAKKNKADWHIFVDSDAYIGNDFVDIVEMVPKTNVIVFKGGEGNTRFKMDDYMRRYNKFIDVGSWFFAFSDWTIDAFKPIHLQSGEPSVKQLIKNIFPTALELNGPVSVQPSHLIDDYILCRNIAKYGLKLTILSKDFPDLIHPVQHTCFDKVEAKENYMKLLEQNDKNHYWSLLKDHEWANELKQMGS